MIFKSVIIIVLNCIITIICTVSCLYFMMEILFSLGSVHPAYVFNLWVGILSHITGSICCIYISVKSVKEIHKKLKKTDVLFLPVCTYTYKLVKSVRGMNQERSNKKEIKNTNAFTALTSTKNAKYMNLFVLIRSLIVLLCAFSATYFFVECVASLFPLSLSRINDCLFEFATHMLGCLCCLNIMIRTIGSINSFCCK